MTRGEHMRSVREASGLTQAELAARAGVSHQTLGYIERDVTSPRLDTLELLADALCIGLDDYVGRVVLIG